MGRRFEYDTMSADEFKRDLEALSMKPLAFARIFGVGNRTVERWCDGQNNIPNWIPVVLHILTNAPEALPEARNAAAEWLVRDNLRPELGEYPFKERYND